jgi:hypothetical protein
MIPRSGCPPPAIPPAFCRRKPAHAVPIFDANPLLLLFVPILFSFCTPVRERDSASDNAAACQAVRLPVGATGRWALHCTSCVAYLQRLQAQQNFRSSGSVPPRSPSSPIQLCAA